VMQATPAQLVAVHDVTASYQRRKEARSALVISGSAENVGSEPLQLVQLAAVLRDGGHHSLASQAVYCGNNLSTVMVGQMTPHEVEFFQKLPPPRTFSLQPSSSCSFVVVFLEPPSGANGFDISVAQAVPQAAPPASDPAP